MLGTAGLCHLEGRESEFMDVSHDHQHKNVRNELNCATAHCKSSNGDESVVGIPLAETGEKKERKRSMMEASKTSSRDGNFFASGVNSEADFKSRFDAC